MTHQEQEIDVAAALWSTYPPTEQERVNKILEQCIDKIKTLTGISE